jgi:hypothetical protein
LPLSADFGNANSSTQGLPSTNACHGLGFSSNEQLQGGELYLRVCITQATMCRNRGSQALMEGRSANRREKRSTEEFPELTYVVTIKVEHLLVHVELLPVLQQNRLPIRDLDLLALIAQGDDDRRAVKRCEGPLRICSALRLRKARKGRSWRASR